MASVSPEVFSLLGGKSVVRGHPEPPRLSNTTKQTHKKTDKPIVIIHSPY